MRTAVDTSVLLAIFKSEPDGAAWLEGLQAWRSEGALVVCEVVIAELAVGIGEEAELRQALDDLGLNYEPLSREAARSAGRAFAEYRREGGPRKYFVPDFLIGAHAQIQADRLAAKDRGYLRRYFASLPLVTPPDIGGDK